MKELEMKDEDIEKLLVDMGASNEEDLLKKLNDEFEDFCKEYFKERWE